MDTERHIGENLYKQLQMLHLIERHQEFLGVTPIDVETILKGAHNDG